MKAAFLALITATLLSAKGTTVRIDFVADVTQPPVQMITDEVGAFHIWSGPGVFVNRVEQTEGFIIDWAQRVSEPAAHWSRITVRFYTECGPTSTCQPALSYVVRYAVDPATGLGYVYLPGRDDPEFASNAAMLHGHGHEGNWFRATSAWEQFARRALGKR